MKKVRVMQYKVSKGAKALVAALKEESVDALRLKVRGSKYRGFLSHLIVNWGCSERRTIRDGIDILNEPEAVDKAQDKVKTLFALLEEAVPTPDFTTSREVAETWAREGDKVYCRTLTRAREGRGIVLATAPEEVVSAPLYTKGLAIQRELRVHVFRGEVLDYIQKKKMGSERRQEEGIDHVDMDIRNHHNGWVFARADVHLEEADKQVAIHAVEALGLDFGAVDLVVTPQDAPRVLEVNTAPGLQGTTLENYKNAILELARSNEPLR